MLDTLAGLMAAAAMLLGVLALFNVDLSLAGTQVAIRPIRMGVPAIGLALIAAAIGGRHQRLAGVAVAFTGVCWVVGMILAVVTQNPLY